MSGRRRRSAAVTPVDPAHAAGKRKRGPAPELPDASRPEESGRRRRQPWVPTSGLVGRKRRSARRG